MVIGFETCRQAAAILGFGVEQETDEFVFRIFIVLRRRYAGNEV